MSREPKPSGTVALLRDRDALEVLLLQRATDDGGAGAWVFPGGKVEAADRTAGAEPMRDARRAAVRETFEEASLELDPGTLLPISRWITPAVSSRRFDTWFFLARSPGSDAVRVDGREIGAHRWLRPREVIEAHRRGQLRLSSPTFVTVAWLTEFADGAQALETWAPRPVPLFEPRVIRREEGACMLYAGDAGYARSDPALPGARHRLWARPARWRYELRLD